jgi:SAM-dependent methyltransferase
MGYMRHKYTKSYYLKEDSDGNPTIYGAEGVPEFKEGKVRELDLNILSRIDFHGKCVLDLGFGRGEAIKYAIENGARRVVGVDFSEDANVIVQKFLLSYDLQAELYCMDALSFFEQYALLVDSEAFDIIIMLDFVEHVPRYELSEVLNQMRNWLTFRAVLAINTPVFKVNNDVVTNGLDPKARDTSDDYEGTSGMHCNRYTKKSLRNYMRDCGFLAISGHFFVPNFSIPRYLQGSRYGWRKAFQMGYPILLSAINKAEIFEYAISWEEIRKREKIERNLIKRVYRFAKSILRAILKRMGKLRYKIYHKILISGLPKMAMDKRYFDLWESLGFHIIPVHFHQPIPDTKTLSDAIWNRTSKLVGIDLNTTMQFELLNKVFPNFVQECNFPREQTNSSSEFYLKNGAFLSVDAEVFHCMIRHFQPKRIIEIGSGSTTYLAAKACILNKENNGINTDVIAIDPFPNDNIKRGFRGFTTLIQKPVEQVEINFFSQLEANDILFIDSSHIVGIGGDVNYEFLEIIPRLNTGVIVHVHDIFFPAEYPKKWIFEDRYFWNEQYILQAFLSFNFDFEILWSSSYMHLNYSDRLKAFFPSYTNLREDYPNYPQVWPSSLWFRRKHKRIIDERT